MTMLRVIVEGRTEARFVTQILAPHLGSRNVHASASPVITRGSRSGVRKSQGGGDSYLPWRRDITDWIKSEGHHRDFWFTTMFDLYGLARVRDFPGYGEACKLVDPEAKVASLEAALGEDIGFARFIPYVQLHEFESLILVEPSALKNIFIEQEKAVEDLAHEISETGCPPEHIDEGVETRPSARICKHLPVYEGNKVVAGPDAAASIGLPRLVAACPHFGAWVQRLEKLGIA
jgi:Domain of unknown function (DUF4276)